MASKIRTARHLRLTLEVFHDIEEFVVDIGLTVKLNLDLVEIAESVLM